MIRLHIKGILLDENTCEPEVILSTEDELNSFSINIGPAEANAIIVALEEIKTPRPLMHDVFIRFLSQHGFKIESLEIYALVENNYFSRLWYKKGLKRYQMEIRPSDGLALAVRLNIPIYSPKGLLAMNPDLQISIDNKAIYKDSPAFFG
jgi:bifunctional DNase/RNase